MGFFFVNKRVALVGFIQKPKYDFFQPYDMCLLQHMN